MSRSGLPRPQVRHAFWLTVLAVLLLLGFASTAFADNYFNRGVAWGADLPTVPNARDLNPLGVNTFLDQEVDRANVYHTLKMIAGGGFHWVRQGFAWNDIEISGKGVFTDTRDPAHPVSSWDKYDFMVDEANKLGLEFIARLDSTPDWARNPCDANGLPAGCDDLKTYTKGPPTNYDDYGDFVYAVVSHFKGRVRYFQIWNEPNLQGEWGGKPINAADFTRLLKIAYTRAKQANPDAVILMPGLAPTDDKTFPANESDLLFLQDMYNAGAKDYFDIASVMIYGFQEPPTTHRTEFNRFNFSRPILTHEVMVRNGDSNKPIWGSEYAWLSLSPNLDWPPDPRYGNQKSMWGDGVAEQTQGDWLKEGYERTRTDWPWMGVMCVWKFRDPINNPTLPASWFSIVNNDFSPRPAYDILHDYARTGAWGTVADVGVHTVDSLAINWQGDWNKANGVADGKKGDRLTISSIGDGLKLYTDVPVHYQIDGGSGSDTSPASDGAVSIPFATSAYSHAVTVQLLADNAHVSGFTTYRNQPIVLTAGIPAAYVATAVGLVYTGYRLLPWAVYILDTLFAYLLFALAKLWLALRWLGRSLLSFLRRLGFLVLYLSLPRNRVSPTAVSLYLPANLQSAIYNLQSRIAPWLLALSVALFYLPVTRAELLKDINPWPLIIGGLLAAFFDLLVPEVGLALVLALIPLYLTPGYADIGFMEIGWGPKYIGHYYVPISELLLLLTAAVVGWRIVVAWAVNRFAPAAWQPEDRARTTVVQSIRTPLAQVVQYLRTDSFALLAILWVALGCFSLLTVTDRAYLGDSIRELRWTIIEPVLFYFLYTYVVGRSQQGGQGMINHAPTQNDNIGAQFIAPLSKMFLLFDFLIAAAVVVSIIGIGQFFFGTNTVNVENLSRVTSVYEHPNSLALYLGRVLPLIVAFAVLLPAAYRRRRIIYALTSVIIALTVYLTYSRGAILGVGGALVVIALLGGRAVIARQWRQRRNLTLAAAAVIVLGGAVAAYLALGRLLDVGSVSLRTDIWKSALAMIKDHPIFGVGLDQFGNQYPHYATQQVIQVGEVFTSHPHNFLLDYWLRLGIIGLLLGGLTIFAFYRFGWWLARLTRNPLHRAIVVALLASMTDFVLHGLVDQAYFVQDLALIFWFTLASMEATRRLVLDEKLSFKEIGLKTIVVGGAGFVGSHLAEALLAGGDEVTVVDNLLTGRENNISQLLGDPDFRFVRRDAITPITANEIAEWGEGIDRLYYLASPASPDDYFAWPVETLRVNSEGVYNFLQLAERNQARFLLTSTSEAYGDPLVHPQPETYWGNVNPIGPRACYDEGKRFAEALTTTFVRTRTLDGRLVRIFNTYGPRMKANDGRVVSNFIYNALKGKPLTIYGDGSYTRSFCYVSDLVRGLITVMEAPSDVASGEVFNLGNPDEHTILEFAKTILKLTGADVPISFQPARTDDPTRRKPDITKVQTQLGWQPQVPLEEGLGKTIEWFRTQP